MGEVKDENSWKVITVCQRLLFCLTKRVRTRGDGVMLQWWSRYAQKAQAYRQLHFVVVLFSVFFNATNKEKRVNNNVR